MLLGIPCYPIVMCPQRPTCPQTYTIVPLCASCNANLCRHYCIFQYQYCVLFEQDCLVSHLFLNKCCPSLERSTQVFAPISTSSSIVMPICGILSYPLCGWSKSESVCTNYATCMNRDIISQFTSLIDNN